MEARVNFNSTRYVPSSTHLGLLKAVVIKDPLCLYRDDTNYRGTKKPLTAYLVWIPDSVQIGVGRVPKAPLKLYMGHRPLKIPWF